MSQPTTTSPEPAAASGKNLPHRYTSALAEEIEMRWQDWWDEHRTFETPNPSGPLGDPEAVAARGERLFVLDMFRTRPERACTSAIRSGSSGPTSTRGSSG